MIRCSSSQFTSTTLTHLPSNPLRARRMTRGTGHSPPDVPSPPGNFSLEKILQRENVLTLFRIKTITLILYCYNRFVKVKVVVARRGIKYHRGGGRDGTGRGQCQDHDNSRSIVTIEIDSCARRHTVTRASTLCVV